MKYDNDGPKTLNLSAFGLQDETMRLRCAPGQH